MQQPVLSISRYFKFYGLFFFISGITWFSCQHESSNPFIDKSLFLPDGFRAIIVADSIGKARHIAVSDEGYIYVKLRRPHLKKYGNVALQDTTGDGRADVIAYFGEYPSHGSLANGMEIYQDYLYYASELIVYRQKLTPGKLVPDTPVDTVLIDDHEHGNHWHITKPIAFDNAGKMYVPFGSPSNACQDLTYSPGGKPGVPGLDPCPELEQHGGIWQFDAGKINLTQRDGIRYTTGVRSVVGLTYRPSTGKIYGMMHGRDNLFMLFPDRYDRWQSALLPAEELLEIREGADYGWPYCYYDHMVGKNVLAPEYGGDGKINGRCDSCDLPLMGFPGHWAPNDLLFYDGDQFPARYKEGAFIAFHGSTNRTPYPQAGYFVCFVPFTKGKPTGDWEVFADGFAQVDTIENTSDAIFRPMGLAAGPDGSLYITDSNKGRIWRISYHGDPSTFNHSDLAAMETRKSLPHIRTPDPILDDLQRNGYGMETNYLTYCAPCHQRDGLGASGRFPPLTDPNWIAGDKERLIQAVLFGLSGNIVVGNESYNNVMPGFAYLDDAVISEILSYIRQSFGNDAGKISSEEVRLMRERKPSL